MNTAALHTRWPIVAPHGMTARVFLSFMATAGFFYVNIMPALVSGLIDGLQFTARQAGLVSAANVYGAALGALVIVLAVARARWRPLAMSLLATLIAIDLASMHVRQAEWLMALRFLHGCAGGALVGLTYSLIARTRAPDRTFGVLLIVQFGLGGLGLLVLPPLVPQFGSQVLFIALIAVSITGLIMMQFLDDYASSADTAQSARTTGGGWAPLVLTLLAVFLFQAANMGLAAYVIEIARAAALPDSRSGPALAVANWLGVVGAGLVVVLATRLGRRGPLAIGIALTALGSWGLHFSSSPWIYFAANALVAITWAMVIAYLLGMCAQLRPDGRIAVIGGFVSKMGLASGPAAFAWATTGSNYDLLINIAVAILVTSGVLALAPAAALDRSHDR